ncbi:hypothetical protein LT493_18270 [Streptomyces tricolor]|nr:hypothetical protein [Streptomyces tricolor]
MKADRVRAWRHRVNPSAPELPDAAFGIARVLFLGMAGVGIFASIQGFGVSDNASWSDQELTSAVREATEDLDGFTVSRPTVRSSPSPSPTTHR